MDDSSSISNESLLRNQPSSRSSFRRKLKFFIPFIIIFTIIITGMISVFAILKHQIDSQSLAFNPTRAIQQVCDFHPVFFSPYSDHIIYISELLDSERPYFDVDLCIKSISLLHVNSSSKTNPSKIFALSLVAAINQLTEITSSIKALLPKSKNLKYEAAMKNCSDLFDHSLTHLTRSFTEIGVDPDENILRNKEMVGDLKTWINVAESNIGVCFDWFNRERESGRIDVDELREKTNIARAYVSNSFVILGNIDAIFDMFYPIIGIVLGSFLSYTDRFTFLVIFCPQFLFVAALFGALFRIHR